MDRNALRGKLQEETIEEWVRQDYNGYALISMGVGKSRLMALAIKRYLEDHPHFDYKKYDHPIVLLVNSQNLRDKEIPKELKKWGVTIKVKIVCYQTAYRWKKKIGLLLTDELDFAITEGRRYLQVFHKCKYDHWLGVTGTMVEGKGEIAEEVFKKPPFYQFSLADAQNFGLINKTEIWVHEVPLYTSPVANAPYGEVEKYRYIQQQIDDCVKKISGIYDELERQPTYDREYDLKGMLTALKRRKEWWESNRKNTNCRLNTVHTFQSLRDYVLKFKYHLLQIPKNKIIMFGELTAEIDKIAAYVFHGKQPDSSVIDALNEGQIRELGVVRKTNRGVNFEQLNQAIIHSYTSSVTNAAQGYIGRMVRLDPSELAYIHFLVSYYYEGDEKVYCQNYTWLQSFLNSEELKHLNINYYDGVQILCT